MRAMTLMLVLALAAMPAMPAVAAGYGTSEPAQGAAGSSSSTMESMPAETPATTSTTTTTMMTTTMSQSDPLVISSLSRFYGFDQATISQLQAKGYMASDFAMVGNLSARTGRPVSEFVQLRDQGMSWMEIAQRYNVSMTDMMAAMPMMSPEVESYNRSFVSQYFGLSSSQIDTLRMQGMNWADIYFAANLAARTNRPVSEIASLRMQGMSWSDIGGRYNVASSDLSRPFISPRVAGVTAMVMPSPQAPILSMSGEPVLTPRDAQLYRKMGYDWRSIAIATNIALRTGDSVRDILRMTDRGMTWPMVAREYGLDPKDVIDVSNYPYARNGEMMMPQGTMMQPGGAMQPASPGMPSSNY
ncbi:MAG: hypothetical protein Q7N50_13545 [Armatimonadota bacterium]|nr:hypothetical protein [Armatimonadota bacterium]